MAPQGVPGNVRDAAEEKKPATDQRPAPQAAVPADTPPNQLVNKERRQLLWACVWGYLGINFFMFLRFGSS